MYMLDRYGKYLASSSFSASSRPVLPTMGSKSFEAAALERHGAIIASEADKPPGSAMLVCRSSCTGAYGTTPSVATAVLVKALGAFLTIMNPFANLPFLSLRGAATQRRTAVRTMISSTVTYAVMYAFGSRAGGRPRSARSCPLLLLRHRRACP